MGKKSAASMNWIEDCDAILFFREMMSSSTDVKSFLSPNGVNILHNLEFDDIL